MENLSIGILQSIILGIIQGITEFLPISSTAHLVLAPYFFNWQDPGLSFDVALHFGTLLAVVIYFRKDWLIILKKLFSENKKQPVKKVSTLPYNTKISNFQFPISNNKLLLLIIIATIPGAALGYFFTDLAETVFRHPLVIAFCLFFFGLLLFLTDKYFSHKKNIEDLSYKQSLLIGLAQVVAIIPGVSRSGATMTAGLGLGLNREQAARFSFLLSAPIILGAVLSQLPALLESANINIEALLLGIIFSAVSGYLAIKYMLIIVCRWNYQIFFWYRLILAIIIVGIYFVF